MATLFSDFFPRATTQFFFISGPASTLTSPLLVAGPLKKDFFAAFLTHWMAYKIIVGHSLVNDPNSRSDCADHQFLCMTFFYSEFLKKMQEPGFIYIITIDILVYR